MKNKTLSIKTIATIPVVLLEVSLLSKEFSKTRHQSRSKDANNLGADLASLAPEESIDVNDNGNKSGIKVFEGENLSDIHPAWAVISGNASLSMRPEPIVIDG